MTARPGTDVDVAAIKRVFMEKLGFHVIVYNDPTSAKIR